MILIFSIENELSTFDVVKWLNHFEQDVITINPDDDVHKLIKINNKGIYFENTITGKVFNLLEVKSCWWRRTGIGLKNFLKSTPKNQIIINNDFDLTDLISGSKSLIKSETEALKEYIFKKVYQTAKINIGSPMLYDLNRLTLIDLAKKKGLKTPKYEILTNLDQIKQMQNVKENRFVSKSISNGIYEQIGQRAFYSYTELHHKSDYKDACADLFPSLIMELIEKTTEIRSFYLEGHFYSMVIFSQTNEQTKIDFRKYSDVKPNKTEPYQLPQDIEMKLKSVFDEIGLNCGSVDLILDRNGDYVFLEINPVGQYGMTSEPGNYNLDKVIAKYLMHGKIC